MNEVEKANMLQVSIAGPDTYGRPMISVAIGDQVAIMTGGEAEIYAAMINAAAEAMKTQLVCVQPQPVDPAWYR